MLSLQKILTFLREDSGQDLIEYALVAAFVGFGAVASMRTLASAVRGVFNNVGTVLTGSL